METNLFQAINAYKSAAGMGSGSKTASLEQSPHLPGEGPSRFKPSFEELLGQSLGNARNAGYTGESVGAESVANKAEFHELITAVNNADLTLRTVVAVRDKMVSAYQDILRMPI